MNSSEAEHQLQTALRHQRREIFQSFNDAEARLQQELQRVLASKPELYEVAWAFLLGVWASLLCVGIALCCAQVWHKRHAARQPKAA
tara:strand:+ start:208 stop:468 length:261 start_codon:yes stop_codon:yes gene_type:complete